MNSYHNPFSSQRVRFLFKPSHRLVFKPSCSYIKSFITAALFKDMSALPVNTSQPHLSELAGRLVTGLKIDTRSKQQYSKYTRPILNGVNRSKVLQRKCPPGETNKETEASVLKRKKEKHKLLYYLNSHLYPTSPPRHCGQRTCGNNPQRYLWGPFDCCRMPCLQLVAK